MRALDLAERSEVPNPGDQKGEEPPFLAFPQRALEKASDSNMPVGALQISRSFSQA